MILSVFRCIYKQGMEGFYTCVCKSERQNVTECIFCIQSPIPLFQKGSKAPPCGLLLNCSITVKNISQIDVVFQYYVKNYICESLYVFKKSMATRMFAYFTFYTVSSCLLIICLSTQSNNLQTVTTARCVLHTETFCLFVLHCVTTISDVVLYKYCSSLKQF